MVLNNSEEAKMMIRAERQKEDGRERREGSEIAELSGC